MNYKYFIFSITLYLLIGAWLSAPALAVTPPSFPSCLNPEGEKIVSYSNGVHGIPGNSAEYKGSDDVYRLPNDRLIQCFCSEAGDGIQTNWWKVSSLRESEINILKNLGWILIPTGSVWGLEDDPYMAFNSTYSCKTTTTTTSSGGGDDGQGGPSVSPGEVLGLATTGNISVLYGLLALGAVSLILGIVLARAKNDVPSASE